MGIIDNKPRNLFFGINTGHTMGKGISAFNLAILKGNYVILHFKAPHNPRGSLSLFISSIASSCCLLPAGLPDSLGSFRFSVGWPGL